MGFVKLFDTKKRTTKMPTQFQLRISLQQFMVETIREQAARPKDRRQYESRQDLPSKKIKKKASAGKSKNGQNTR